MSGLINLEIAGVNLAISCLYSISLNGIPEAYQPFLRKLKSADGTINININLELNNIPETKNMSKICDTGQSWTMFMNNDEYFLTLSPPALENKPVWLARFNRDFKKATIYCGDMFLHKIDNRTILTNPVCYPLDQLLFMYILAQKEGAMIHAAGLCFRDKGYIFPGKSGAGKSTISRQLNELDDYEFLSDDRIIVRKMDKTFKAFGTPWSGEAGIAVNKNVKLSGIFFISQASYNKIEEIKPQKAMESLLPVVSIPWYDKEVLVKILDFCEDLTSNVPAYELYFKPDIEVADVFKKFVSKQ